MKNIYLIITILATIGWFSSCSDDHEPIYRTGNEKPAQINTPETGKEYVLDKENKYDILDTFKWIQAEYSIPVGMRYTLEVEKEDGNFEKPVVLTSVTQNEMSFTIQEFNTAMEKLGLTPKEKSKVKLRVMTNAYGGEEGVTPLSQLPTLYSDVIELYVTTYEEDRAYPENLYMIGVEFGNWEWENEGIVEMLPVNGKEGEFWCINYFTADNGFKWAPKKAWTNGFNALDTNTGFTLKGDDAIVDADGVYMVYINMKSSEICIEPAQVYGIGNCFGGWNGVEPVLFSISGKTISQTTTSTGGLRMYAASSIQTSDWWTREFVIMDGKIEYRGNGGELAEVTVSAGKTVTLDFRAGTGTIN